MSILHKIRRMMDTILSGLCILLFALMIVAGTYQIVARYFFNSPSTVSEELLTYSFTWMALLAAAYVFGKRGHMRMGFVADRLRPGLKLALDIALEMLTAVFSALVLVHGGISIMRLTMTQTTASLGIPMGIVYLAVPLTGILTLIYCVLNIIDLCAGRARPEQKLADLKSRDIERG